MTPTRIKVIWGLYWVAVFAVMHIPKDRLPRIDVSVWDKQVHFVCYGVLAGLCALSARRNGTVLTWGWYAKWWAVHAAYAAVDEVLQGLPLVNRTADVGDWLADMIGVLAGFGVIGLMGKRL